MKNISTLALATLAFMSIGAHAADAASAAASKPAKHAACAKSELGGVVTSTKMTGETLVIGFKNSADNFKIRKKDDATLFGQFSKLKVGDTHCYKDEGS